MALEINEIGIHFRVPDAERRDEAAPASGPCNEVDRAQIVEDCVRRVLQLLAARAER
ncbi:MAG TPA: DUF5908 family protein [Longimicrobium sp.]|jgi:hypothetical protein|nr:DUF5908 family protein [Longimicrobium sp.]